MSRDPSEQNAFIQEKSTNHAQRLANKAADHSAVFGLAANLANDLANNGTQEGKNAFEALAHATGMGAAYSAFTSAARKVRSAYHVGQVISTHKALTTDPNNPELRRKGVRALGNLVQAVAQDQVPAKYHRMGSALAGALTGQHDFKTTAGHLAQAALGRLDPIYGKYAGHLADIAAAKTPEEREAALHRLATSAQKDIQDRVKVPAHVQKIVDYSNKINQYGQYAEDVHRLVTTSDPVQRQELLDKYRQKVEEHIQQRIPQPIRDAINIASSAQDNQHLAEYAKPLRDSVLAQNRVERDQAVNRIKAKIQEHDAARKYVPQSIRDYAENPDKYTIPRPPIPKAVTDLAENYERYRHLPSYGPHLRDVALASNPHDQAQALAELRRKIDDDKLNNRYVPKELEDFANRPDIYDMSKLRGELVTRATAALNDHVNEHVMKSSIGQAIVASIEGRHEDALDHATTAMLGHIPQEHRPLLKEALDQLRNPQDPDELLRRLHDRVYGQAQDLHDRFKQQAEEGVDYGRRVIQGAKNAAQGFKESAEDFGNKFVDTARDVGTHVVKGARVAGQIASKAGDQIVRGAQSLREGASELHDDLQAHTRRFLYGPDLRQRFMDAISLNEDHDDEFGGQGDINSPPTARHRPPPVEYGDHDLHPQGARALAATFREAATRPQQTSAPPPAKEDYGKDPKGTYRRDGTNLVIRSDAVSATDRIGGGGSSSSAVGGSNAPSFITPGSATGPTDSSVYRPGPQATPKAPPDTSALAATTAGVTGLAQTAPETAVSLKKALSKKEDITATTGDPKSVPASSAPTASAPSSVPASTSKAAPASKSAPAVASKDAPPRYDQQLTKRQVKDLSYTEEDGTKVAPGWTQNGDRAAGYDAKIMRRLVANGSIDKDVIRAHQDAIDANLPQGQRPSFLNTLEKKKPGAYDAARQADKDETNAKLRGIKTNLNSDPKTAPRAADSTAPPKVTDPATTPKVASSSVKDPVSTPTSSTTSSSNPTSSSSDGVQSATANKSNAADPTTSGNSTDPTTRVQDPNLPSSTDPAPGTSSSSTDAATSAAKKAETDAANAAKTDGEEGEKVVNDVSKGLNTAGDVDSEVGDLATGNVVGAVLAGGAAVATWLGAKAAEVKPKPPPPPIEQANPVSTSNAVQDTSNSGASLNAI